MRLSPGKDGVSSAVQLLGWQPELPIAKIVPREHGVVLEGPTRFKLQDPVYFRIFPAERSKRKWQPGIVVGVEGTKPKIYVVSDMQGGFHRRASCHVRGRNRHGAERTRTYDPSYLDKVGQNPVDLRDHPVNFSPYEWRYGRMRTAEEQADANASARTMALRQPSPPPMESRHRLRPTEVESTSSEEDKELSPPLNAAQTSEVETPGRVSDEAGTAQAVQGPPVATPSGRPLESQ